MTVGPRRRGVEVHVGLQARQQRVGVHLQLQAQHALRLAAPDGQEAVRRDVLRGLAVVVVVLELGALGLLALHHAGGHVALVGERVAQQGAHVGVVGHHLGHDVTGALQGLFGAGHFLLGGHEGLRLVQRAAVERLGQDAQRQRLEALLLGDGGPRAALLLVRRVEVLEGRLGAACQDALLQLGRELALLLDAGQHRRAALVQLAQVGLSLLDVADLHLVEAARDLFAVARDEGHRGALLQQLDHRRHAPGRQLQLHRDRAHHVELACCRFRHLALRIIRSGGRVVAARARNRNGGVLGAGLFLTISV
jgi:hypothetical protein